MEITGKISLLFQGNHLIKEEIDQNLQIKTSRFTKSGESVSSAIKPPTIDTWIYDIVYKNNNVDDALDKLLSEIIDKKEYLKNMSSRCDVYIKCFIQSEFAQINTVLSTKTIKKLSDLNLEFCISIFSWGLADSK